MCEPAGTSPHSHGRRRPRKLKGAYSITADKTGPPSRPGLWLLPSQQWSLIRTARQHDARGGQIAERLHDRLVHGAHRSTNAAREHEVETNVLSLRQQGLQRRKGVGGIRRHQVIVVHEEVDFRTPPPRAIAQLLGRDIGTR